MGTDKFKCGDKCFFYIAAGIGSFGTVISVDRDGTQLTIISDDGHQYTGQNTEVIKIGRKTDF